jgi:cytochrome c-type protein NapC
MNIRHAIRTPVRPLTLVRVLACVLAIGMAPLATAAVDWSKAKEKEIVLFYPGQASWEWVMTQADHSGATKFRGGKNCRGCHDGEQADIGAEILAGGHKLEAHPPAGKPGALHLFVRTAHDADRLYFQFRWKPGPAKNPARGDTAARVTVMLDDGGIKESARAGCWASCHDDAMEMASAAPGSKITTYLGGSRAKLTRQGGGAQHKPDADLKALLAQGAFLEYWQARLNPGKPATAVGGYILADRAKAAAPGVTADANFAGGQWIVTLSRPLKPAGAGQKALVAGKPYSVGFAVHDDYAEHRHHHVSLEYTLQIDGGTADFVATGK